MNRSNRRAAGFTLVELMVVLAVVALLISIVVPDYVGRVRRAEEAVLKENLMLVRDALDKHYADVGKYPASLDELVTRRYLRAIPADPLTQSSASWIVVAPTDPRRGSIYDIKSGAKGSGSNGTPYQNW